MKTKGITIWERYVHLMVLGVAVLIFITFAAMQFLTEPNAVQGSGKGAKAVLPGEVDPMLEEAAKRIQAKIAPGTPSPVQIAKQSTHVDDFQSRLDASISPVERLAVSDYRFSPAEAIGMNSSVSKKPYNVPTVPAPTQVVAKEYYDTLTADAQKSQEALAKLIPVAPYDIHWATAGAEFPLKELLASYSQHGPDGELAIQPLWYGQTGKGVDILDVRVERQELVDGNWTDDKILDPIPGQYSLRAELSGKPDASLRTKLLGYLITDPARQSEIIEPTFYPTVGD
ncbi:MAG TPA: hypothetical protein VG711_04500, partial [Phycisphaerales bacterium]|nr:hypothetical protein [Phycisphaerales bacterium]